MKSQGRYDIHVSCEQESGGRDVRSITVTFGQGNRVRIFSASGKPMLEMAAGRQCIELDAGSSSEDLTWAVQLLAAQLPRLREELGFYEPESSTDGA